MQGRYEIRLAGRLPRNWAEWCDGFTCMTSQTGETVLTGPVPDQPALAGLLTALCQMNMTLLSVKRLDGNQAPQGG